jgi:endonuclease/exonuclease/phosphatase family metal-dependent hydrolase
MFNKRLVRTVAALVTLGVAGALTATTTAASPAGAAQRSPVEVRVATYNVRSVSLDRTHGEERPWRERRPYVVANIMGENVDVIGVQEVNPSKAFKSRLVTGKNQYQDLRAGLNAAGGSYALTNAFAFNCKKPSTQYRCKKRNRGASHAERILYNTRTLTLVTQGKLKYGAQTGSASPNYLAWAVLRSNANGAEFLFTTTHLAPKDEGVRRKQWSQMIGYINKIKGARPVVATGDFNTHKHKPLAREFLPKMYQSGYGDTLGQKPNEYLMTAQRAQSTVNAWMNTANKFQRDVRSFGFYDKPYKPGNNIDWIFASNHLPVLEYKVVVNYDPSSWLVNGVIPSDHNMVRASLAIG